MAKATMIPRMGRRWGAVARRWLCKLCHTIAMDLVTEMPGERGTGTDGLQPSPATSHHSLTQGMRNHRYRYSICSVTRILTIA